MTRLVPPSLPRALHPAAWWLWALGLGVAASRTTNPLLLGLVIVVSGFVVAARRGDAPWARSYAVYLRLALLVVVVRLVFQALVGVPVPGHTLVTLPRANLPSWLAGVRLGGPVTLESLASAADDALRLAALLACVGAANALADPRRLLRHLPGALYEAGVAVVVALSLSPQLLSSGKRVREARRLRGRPDRGLAGLRGIALPVLQDALDRSVTLAAAMDSRGYGRQPDSDRGARRVTATLTLGGLLGVCVGAFALLDGSAPAPLGGPLLLAGVSAAVAGLVSGGRRVVRTRYRPDPWKLPESMVTASGLVAGAVLVVAGLAGGSGLQPAMVPLQVPPLPLLPATALLVALLPAWVAPAPPSSGAVSPAPAVSSPRSATVVGAR